MKLRNKYGFKNVNLLGSYCIPVTPSTSKMIQEIVFELGGGWSDLKRKYVHYDEMPFLVLEVKDKIEMFYIKKLGKDHKKYTIISDKDMIIKLLRALVYKQSFEIRNLSNTQFESENE